MSASSELHAPTGASLPPAPGLDAVLDAVADGVLLLRRTAEGCVTEWASRRFESASGLKSVSLVGQSAKFLSLRAADGAPIPLSALFLGAASAVRFVNRGRLGNSPIAVVGRPFASETTLETLEMERRLRNVLATGWPVRFESRGVRADGSEVLFENRIGPVEQGGRITGVILYSTDITDRRALEREILEISNREQRRIGSDLHDGLGQELTGIALMLRGLTSALERGSGLALADLEEVVALVNGAIDTTRTLARGLSPIALEGGGLVYALRALTAHAREMYGIDIRFRSRVTPRVTLDAAATGHLYRIAQESLTNTARHARAKLVTVQFTVRGRRVTLAVTDDGRGIAGAESAGMGLKIMRYRAHMLGGELTIEPAAGGAGTRIVCTLLQPEPEWSASGPRG